MKIIIVYFIMLEKKFKFSEKTTENYKVYYTLCDSKKRTIIHYLCNDEVSSTNMDEKLCDYLL